MAIPLSAWPRTTFTPTLRAASVRLLTFSAGPLATGVPFSESRYGAPRAELIKALDLRSLAREDDPTWFDGWRTGGLRSIAARELTNVSVLDEVAFAHAITCEIADAKDLAYLQTAWAAAIWFVERGASVVLDLHACQWHEDSELASLEPHRSFDLDHEVSFIVEADASAGIGHVMHTRGLAKFARPDLVATVKTKGLATTEVALRRVAASFVQGATIAPGQRISVNDNVSLSFDAYAPGKNAPDVHLNNDGLLLRSIGESPAS